MKLLKAILASTAITLSGCTQKEEATPAPAPTPAAPSLNVTGAKSTSDPAAPAPAPSLPTRGMEAQSATGLQTVDADGKALDTIAGLERAVEYYTRVLVPRTPIDEAEEKTFKPVPPLTDLQQLVEYRVIKAIPAGPDGARYVYDKESGKVKLVK